MGDVGDDLDRALVLERLRRKTQGALELQIRLSGIYRQSQLRPLDGTHNAARFRIDTGLPSRAILDPCRDTGRAELEATDRKGSVGWQQCFQRLIHARVIERHTQLS